MRVRAAVAMGLTIVVLGFSTPLSAATKPKVSVTTLGTSSSFGISGPTSVSCMSAGNCVASGYASNNQAVVRTERDGKWGTPITVTKSLGTVENSILVTTSCFATGCLAFGRYYQSAASTQDEHFTVAYANGHWKKAQSLSLHLGAAKAFQEFKISCSDASDCVVVGTLQYAGKHTATPVYAPAVLTEKAGLWGVPRPLGARSSQVGRLAEFLDVSCPKPGNCVAVGVGATRRTYGSIGAVETNGQWSEAKDAFPANWTVLSVACSTLRDCTVGGRISIANGSEAFVASGRVGHWAAPVQVGKAWTAPGQSESSVNFLSCQSATACVVAGIVDGPHPKRTGKVSISSVAWIVSETKGKWKRGNLIGYRSHTINEGQIDGLSCTSVRFCEVVGQHWTEKSNLSVVGDIHDFAASYAPRSS